MNNNPKHIAIIMDGNGRWAKQRMQPRFFGHREGSKALHRVVSYCVKHKISALTVFAFSTENWSRPVSEVKLLMDLFVSSLQKNIDELDYNNVKWQLLGDISKFDSRLRSLINSAIEQTKNNTGLKLNIAANYGGRWDISMATKKIVEDVNNGNIEVSDIDEQLMTKYMSLNDISAPDLFIRTGGEQRISNFLIWQLAYSELYFTDTYWPDFDEKHMDLAIEHFTNRERRFGRVIDK